MELTDPIGYSLKNNLLTRHSDILLPLSVVGILSVMIMPMPTFILDLLLAFNITIAIIILLVGLYIIKPLDLSAFPSILLLVTLFRLSLNVASTRIILLHGNEGVTAAGKVINAFGSVVVGGNYLVGVIVFLILVVINFMVITKGAGRIAEVAARFTLDAMPGKQMSIDADLNAGLIDEQEARERRTKISREAEYYGAMDGANKFVRGDAIAGIIITLVNIAGGLAIGVFQNSMSFAKAAENYTLLTVGDGLVSQIPALIISTAAGIIVTRAGSESNLGKEVASQIFNQPRALAITSAVLFGLALVPGLPASTFIFLAIFAGIMAYVVSQKKGDAVKEDEAKEALEDVDELPDKVVPLPPVDILGLEVGYGLIPLVDVEQNGEILGRIKSIRRQIVEELGIVVPSIHIQDNIQLKPGDYRIKLKGNEIAGGGLMMNYYLAMNPGGIEEKLKGIDTKEPTFGLPAYWIREEEKEHAVSLGYTVVDPATVLTTHLADIIRRNAHELIGRQEVQQLLDRIKESHPKVVEELVPNLMTLGSVLKVLQNLLAERISVRDFLTILETLADWAPMVKDIGLLTEYVRESLARTITKFYQSEEGDIPVITLDPMLEKEIADAVHQTEQGGFISMDPATVQDIMHSLSETLEAFTASNDQPVVLCSAQIRTHFKKLIDRFIPDLAVLSFNDILSNVQIKSLGTVGLRK
ncbi:MAG: flagellar biosynthesis protein FlhA [Desulfosarcina sp.]|nr:flagellar biosynthesis protein FlhA [Desulfobacterales bacterium]